MKTIFNILDDTAYNYPFWQPLKQIAFFDIETTGLSPKASSLYLIGLMRFDTAKQVWTLTQWFADDYQSEKPIIEAFLENIADISYLFHFNGRTFDIPYLLKKCSQHAITLSTHCKELLEDTTGIHSVDLLTKIRPLRHALSLNSCSQTAIEQWLQIDRTDTFSGGELIQVYSEYMQQKLLRTENAYKLETVLLLHNHDDVSMMRNVSSLLLYDEYLSDTDLNRLLRADFSKKMQITYEDASETLCLSLTLPHALPKEVTITAANETASATLHFKECLATFTLPVCHDTLRFFFPDYKNYYYLPEEDMAMHKSVATFVDSSHRKKATAATCYTKKAGFFLPNFCPAKNVKENFSDLPLFYKQYKDKLSFCELPKDYKHADLFWKRYLQLQLPQFR